MIRVKSIFTGPSADDGYRVLVEPVWPRHAGHKKARVHAWLRYLAPSPYLYNLYTGNAIPWEGFVARYHGEQERNREYFGDLQAHHHNGGLTLLHGSADGNRNIAAALKMLLEREECGILTGDQGIAGPFPGNEGTSQVLFQKMQGKDSLFGADSDRAS
jgi:uncharacterized protein YeaO (DUF488 family)